MWQCVNTESFGPDAEEDQNKTRNERNKTDEGAQIFVHLPLTHFQRVPLYPPERVINEWQIAPVTSSSMLCSVQSMNIWEHSKIGIWFI